MTPFMIPLLAIALLSLAAGPILAQPTAKPQASGIESKDYEWNRPNEEQALALSRKGDPVRGKLAYTVCQGCHRADASGRSGALYPQLAGQHATVLIKQMVDVRAGRRDNPKMHPFVDESEVSAEEVADIATYLAQLAVPANNGKGDGSALVRGKALYDKDCASCHGIRGEGDAGEFYPRVASQHYAYLHHEARQIRDGSRRNANTKMVKVIRDYSDNDLKAVSDYISRLPASR
jgi:cytochrome c553